MEAFVIDSGLPLRLSGTDHLGRARRMEISSEFCLSRLLKPNLMKRSVMATYAVGFGSGLDFLSLVQTLHFVVPRPQPAACRQHPY